MQSLLEAAPISSSKVLLSLQKMSKIFFQFFYSWVFCFRFCWLVGWFLKKKIETRPNFSLASNTIPRDDGGGIQFCLFFPNEYLMFCCWFFLFSWYVYVCEFIVDMVYLSISILSTSIVYYSFISLFWAGCDRCPDNLHTFKATFPPCFKNCRKFSKASSSVLLGVN